MSLSPRWAKVGERETDPMFYMRTISLNDFEWEAGGVLLGGSTLSPPPSAFYHAVGVLLFVFAGEIMFTDPQHSNELGNKNVTGKTFRD